MFSICSIPNVFQVCQLWYSCHLCPFYVVYLFISALGLHCCAGFFLVAVSGRYSLFWFRSFSLGKILLLQSMDFRAGRLQKLRCRAQQLQFLGSRAQAQQLWQPGLFALHHAGSSQTRDRTHVSCIGRQILYH